MKIVRAAYRAPKVNLSPLIDVIFILLIFVMLVAKFLDQERLDVTLPSASSGQPAQVDALMLTLDAEGVVTLEGVVVPPEELHDRLVARRRAYERVVLLADRECELQPTVDLIAAAKSAGFEGVALATRPQAR